ncbi:MAG: membrane associated rhomboid family serine protease [Verrucomicrobiales bacterium]|jgi:membrane associated rhomboid family serine protease
MTDPQDKPKPTVRQPWFVPLLDESKPWRSRSLMPLKPDGMTFALRDSRERVAEYETPQKFETAVRESRSELTQKAAVPTYDRWFPVVLLWEPAEGTPPYPIKQLGKPLLISLLLGWLFLAPPKGLPIAGGDSKMLLLLALMFFGIMPLATQLIRWWEDRQDREPDRNKRTQVDLVLFDQWLHSFSSIILKVTLAIFGVVYFLQVFGGIPKSMSLSKAFSALFMGGGELSRSIWDAAMVKHRVLQNGEWWRLVTAGVMHGSLLHIFFNGSALYFLGRVTIAMVGAPLLGLVFLTSIVGGALASLYLSGGRPSVGASGGVMGVLGFLTVILVLHRSGIPRPYKTNLLQAILIMSIFGALGAQYIDNAAHAGGLLVGGLLGIILVPSRDRVWEYSPPRFVNVLGWISWIIIALAGFQVVQLILDWNLF